MAWKHGQWGTQTPKRGPGHWGKPSANKPKKEPAPTHVGYDGRKVSLQSSSLPASSEAPTQNTEVSQLKEVLKSLVGQNLDALTPDQRKMLEPTVGDRIRSKQKDINQERRKYNKERNLEQRIKDNDAKYNRFLEDQRQLLRQERDRYQEEDLRLRQSLEALQKEEEEMDMEAAEEIDQLLFPQGARDFDAALLTQRVAQAERQASDAQQAMLMMSAQMQQMMAYHMTPMQQPPMQPTPEEQLQPAMTPQPGTGPMPGLHGQVMKGGSPQMPKVRQAALKQNQKAKDDKATAAKTGKVKPNSASEAKDVGTKEPTERDVVDLEAEVDGIDASQL